MEYLCTLSNGKKIYYEKVRSHFATHLSDTPQLLKLIKSFLLNKAFTEEKLILENDEEKIIGNTDLVTTTSDDEILYAKRMNRDTFTRFVKNKKPIPTTHFTIALQKDENGDYELQSAWIGRITPQFPDEHGATLESRDFWSHHALVWGTQKIQEGTETKICPW